MYYGAGAGELANFLYVGQSLHLSAVIYPRKNTLLHATSQNGFCLRLSTLVVNLDKFVKTFRHTKLLKD